MEWLSVRQHVGMVDAKLAGNVCSGPLVVTRRYPNLKAHRLHAVDHRLGRDLPPHQPEALARVRGRAVGP